MMINDGWCHVIIHNFGFRLRVAHIEVFGAREFILAILLVASYHAPIWLLVLLLNNVSGGIVSVYFDEFTPK